VATTSDAFRLRQRGKTFFFVRFGGKAAKTNERNGHFRAAAGEKALMRPALTPTA
jgi:hypothetical protein